MINKLLIKNLPFLLSGIIVGIILFQSGLVAPAINKLVNSKDASSLLRFIWPKFFLLIGVISFISFLITLYYNTDQNLFKYFAFASFILMLICYLIIPSINEAKDTSNEQLWSILHLLTIALTLITLLINILFIFFWKSNN
tara:strand:- start:301 stop:723 length:423 start_codon:yes stop_codon:yes gene_type:complete